MPQYVPKVNGTYCTVIYFFLRGGLMIYERIRNLREDMDYTQQHMADLLFINRRTYSSYETGVRGIPTEVLSQIADIFKTSTDYLIGRTDEKKPYPKK